jgi:hypothetical protein
VKEQTPPPQPPVVEELQLVPPQPPALILPPMIEIVNPTKIVPTSAVISLSETQKPFSGPRSMTSYSRSYLTTLEPIHEPPNTATDENDDDNEESPIIHHYNPRLQQQNQQNKANLERGGNSGFADHSAVNDIVSTSYRRQSLLKQGEHQMLDLVNAATTNPGAGHEKTKSVSFSHVNQTIDADNTIRKSSVTVAIVKESDENNNDNNKKEFPRPTPISTNIPMMIGANNMTSPTNRDNNMGNSNIYINVDEGQTPISPSHQNTANATSSNDNNTNSNSNPSSQGPPSIPVPPPRVNHSNLHLEMASLANSVSHYNPTRMLAVSARQSLGSVRSLLGAPSTISQLREETDLDSQQELTEKAVVVIKRVMDKLTGLDFPSEHSSAYQKMGNVHTTAANSNENVVPQALEVSEQVDKLIREAISNENLSQSFFGWCPFW